MLSWCPKVPKPHIYLHTFKALNITIKFSSQNRPITLYQHSTIRCPANTKFSPTVQPLSSAAYPQHSASQYFTFFMSQRSTLPLAYLYQKDERAAWGLFRVENFLFFPVKNKCCASHETKSFCPFFPLSVCECHFTYYTAESTAFFEIYKIQCEEDNYVEF
jgi:hypothetical protein